MFLKSVTARGLEADAAVSLIQDTTFVTATGFIHDVYWRAGQVGRAEFKNLEALFIAAVIYLVVNTLISVSFRMRRFAKAV